MAAAHSRHPHSQTIAPYTVPNQHALRSAFGFFTIPPVSRQDRRTLGDRDAREKNALAERRSGFQRHDPSSNPIESVAESAGFISNEERFHTDVIGELKGANNARLDRGVRNTELRRRNNLDREEQRWRDMDEAVVADAQRAESLAGTSKRNVGGTGYNIVNHDWRNGYDAEMAKFKEDASAWRNANRANTLHKANHAEGFNILTGQPYGQVAVVPSKPNPPQLVGRQQYLP
eukprot:EG_transcript_23861